MLSKKELFDLKNDLYNRFLENFSYHKCTDQKYSEIFLQLTLFGYSILQIVLSFVNQMNSDRIYTVILDTQLLSQILAFCYHCVRRDQIRSFFWSVFSSIQSECRKIRTRKNSVFGYFSRSVPVSLRYLFRSECFKSKLKVNKRLDAHNVQK